MSASIWPFIEQGTDGVAYIEGTRTKVIEVAPVCRLARAARGTAGNLGENRRRATDSQLCRDRQRAAGHSPPDYRSTARARRPQSIPRWKLSFQQQALTQHHARRVIDVQHPHRNDSCLGLADKHGLLPTKVPIPVLPPRIEERIQFSG